MADPADRRDPPAPAFEESAEDLYEHAPCGYISALPGGLIVKVGSRMIDSSLKTKLSSLKLAMKEVG